MNITLDTEALVARAIAEQLPAEKLEQIAKRQLEESFQLLTRKEAAARLGVSERQFNRYEIPYVDLGDKSPRYRPEDLKAFSDKRLVNR